MREGSSSPPSPRSRSNSPSAYAREEDDDEEYEESKHFTDEEADLHIPEDHLFEIAQGEEKAEEKEFLLHPNNAWCAAAFEEEDPEKQPCEYKSLLYKLSETRSRTNQCISHFNQFLKVFSSAGVKIKQQDGKKKAIPSSLEEIFKDLGMKSELGDWRLKKMCIQKCHMFHEDEAPFTIALENEDGSVSNVPAFPIGPFHGISIFFVAVPRRFFFKYCVLPVMIILQCKNFRFFGSVVGREFSFQFSVFLWERSAEFALKR